MRRKPILYNRVFGERNNCKREVIGIIGAHHGAGVTQTGLMLALYMGEERGRKTALLECSSHGDFNLIQPAYEWSSEEGYTFSFGNITCYKNVAPEQIAGISGEDYSCFIIDFGTDYTANREEFLRCGTKIIMGGQVEWNRQKFIRFIKSVHSVRGSEAWLYLMPFADQRTINLVGSEAGRRVYSVPFTADPTNLSKDTIRLFDGLFK